MKFDYRSAALAAATALCLASPAFAEDEAAAGDPNTGALSIVFDNTFTTAYMFRGILQERDGLIWQPSLGLALNVYASEEGPVRSVNLGVGFWNSVHSEDTLASGSGPDAMYETDYAPNISVSWAGGLASTLTYYFYTSPNGAFRTVEELDLALSYDDSDLLGAFALHPTATFAFETLRSSFGGTGKGAVFELGLAPGTTFNDDGKYPISLTVPAKLSLSMDDYFETEYTTPGGSFKHENDTFGYATLGLRLGVPLAFIPARYGLWSVTNGFDLYFLNDVLEDVNQNDGVYPVWVSSITMNY